MGTLKVVCKECEKQIDLKTDKHVLLGTYDGETPTDESYFHFDCWKNYLLNCVEKKAKSMETATSFMDKIKGTKDTLGGIGGLLKVLPKDLKVNLAKGELPNINELFGEEKPQPKETQKQNGTRKKRTTTTTKKKVQ